MKNVGFIPGKGVYSELGLCGTRKVSIAMNLKLGSGSLRNICHKEGTFYRYDCYVENFLRKWNMEFDEIIVVVRPVMDKFVSAYYQDKRDGFNWADGVHVWNEFSYVWYYEYSTSYNTKFVQLKDLSNINFLKYLRSKDKEWNKVEKIPHIHEQNNNTAWHTFLPDEKMEFIQKLKMSEIEESFFHRLINIEEFYYNKITNSNKMITL